MAGAGAGDASETAAVATLADPAVRDGRPTTEQQQADALGLLAETALHHGIDPGTPR